MTFAPHSGNVQNLKAPLPESARGLCWGGFLLSWVWAIFNRTWIGLLGLVPVLGFFIQVLLLIKGREWAWANNDWQSVEHFNRVQRRWSLAGLLILLVPIAAIIAAVAVPNYIHFQARAQQAEAKTRLLLLYNEEKLWWVENDTYTDDLSKLNSDPSEEKRYKIGFAISGDEFREHCPSCAATKTEFKAVAVGRIGSGRLDVWTIDQDRNLVNLVDGSAPAK